MNLTKEQVEAGLRACNHFAEAYPDELTPELYEFILAIEKELLKIIEVCVELNNSELLDRLKSMINMCDEVHYIMQKLAEEDKRINEQ